MSLTFYPRDGDAESLKPREKLELLLEAAEAYKAAVLDIASKPAEPNGAKKRSVPREMTVAYNWNEIAKVMRSIREMPEGSPQAKQAKAEALTKLAEIYEVLRGAKLSKLEAVRLALLAEAKQLSGGSARVA